MILPDIIITLLLVCSSHSDGWSSPCDPLYHHYGSKVVGTLTSNGNYCYEVVSNQTSWRHAEDDCQAKGGHLAHIANSQDQNFIYHFLLNHFKHRVWIGLHDDVTEGHFQWTSGHAVTYRHWSPTRNPLHHGRKDCVELDPADHGYWRDLICESTHFNHPGYICQYRGSDAISTPSYVRTTNAPAVPTTAANHSRLDGNTAMCSSQNLQHSQRYGTVLAQYSSSCYELIPNKKVSWNQAETICTSNGGHLISINSAAAQTFIQSFMQRHLPGHAVWIGLNDLMWEGQFEWSSGSSVSYNNFLSGHRGNFMNHDMENCCVLIPYKGGKWDDIPCDTQDGLVDTHAYGGETHPPLCQYPIVTAPIIG